MHSISTVRSRDDHERHSRPAGSNGPEDQGPPAETCGGRFLGKLSGALHCVGCGAHKPPKLRIQPKSFGTVERLRPRRLPRQQPVARGARLSSQGWGWLRGQSRSAARHHAAVTQGRRSSCRGAKCFANKSVLGTGTSASPLRSLCLVFKEVHDTWQSWLRRYARPSRRGDGRLDCMPRKERILSHCIATDAGA